MDIEQKRAYQREAKRRWRAENPERSKELQRQARERYKQINATADWSHEHETIDRKCRKCGEIKKLKDFATSMVCKYAKNYMCSSCNSKKTGDWKKSNPERAKGQKRRWEERHPEKAKEHKRRWARKNSEKLAEYRKKWYEENKECLREKARIRYREWYEKNKERLREKARIRYREKQAAKMAED